MIENIFIVMERDTLTKKIMRRVYVAYALRKVLHPTACKIYGLVFVIAGVASFVSFGNILQNAPSGSVHLYNFLTYAFWHTEFVVQLLVAMGVALFVWLVFDISRKVSLNAFTEQTA